jgi:hypothetical protein
MHSHAPQEPAVMPVEGARAEGVVVCTHRYGLGSGSGRQVKLRVTTSAWGR